MSYIFVSYARKNAVLVQQVVDELRRRNFRIWMDKNNIAGGQNWQNAIKEAVNASSALLLFLSPESVDSEWVGIELDEALNAGKTVIPYCLEECEIPLRLKKINYIHHDSGDAMEELVAVLPNAARLFGPSDIVKSGLIGRTDMTFEQAAAAEPNGVIRLDSNRTNLIGLPLEPTQYCMSYLVGQAEHDLSWQPTIQLAIQMSQDYLGSDFPVKVARYLLNRPMNAVTQLRMLLVRGPLQLATQFNKGIVAAHGLDNHAPAEWEDAVQASVTALKHYYQHSERPDLVQFFAIAPAALTGALGLQLERGWGVEFYNFIGDSYVPVYTVPRH